MTALLRRGFRRKPIRTLSESALDSGSTIPNASGLAFIDNSQGASAAVVELSSILDDAIEKLDLQGKADSVYLPKGRVSKVTTSLFLVSYQVIFETRSNDNWTFSTMKHPSMLIQASPKTPNSLIGIREDYPFPSPCPFLRIGNHNANHNALLFSLPLPSLSLIPSDFLSPRTNHQVELVGIAWRCADNVYSADRPTYLAHGKRILQETHWINPSVSGTTKAVSLTRVRPGPDETDGDSPPIVVIAIRGTDNSLAHIINLNSQPTQFYLGSSKASSSFLFPLLKTWALQVWRELSRDIELDLIRMITCS